MPAPQSAPIGFRVLGAVEVFRNGQAVPLGGRRQRALLALLLLEPGRSVAADRLVDELWSGSPPDAAATTLRAYVSKLRTALGPDAPITGTTSGYALDILAERVDGHRFERLAREGREALARGAVRRAADLLRDALALWRGEPFADLDGEGALRIEGERLEELRLLALEDRIDADLALGRQADLLDELERLVREHPYRERLWRQLMLALYRAERQVDALAAYRRARRLLADELGIDPSEELQRLEQAILRHEVPPARPPAERPDVPAPITSFIGREAELADVGRLLGEARLVTLSGVGGAGKTRLALEAIARALPGPVDGAVFVDFSGLADPALVPNEVAAALDVGEQSEVPAVEELVARMRDTELLLVLDNCEHVRDACAALAQRLLAAIPRLRILATSRGRLGVPGEVDYAVPPLALPAPDATLDEIRVSEAVRLFLARAREARPRLSNEDAVISTAARICRDLDGLPLAIELAAARAKALSLEDIATRLADRFRFLVSWRRLSAARHRTLREALDWSYELLADDERAVLDRLSIFAGGFTLDAVSSVCVDGDDSRAVDLLGRLVDASLVVAEERDGGMRYRLLETVRQYAAERLAARGEVDDVCRRHAEHFLAIAEQAEPALTGERQAWWFGVLETEHDNLRTALGYLATEGEPDHSLRLTIALTRFWYVRGFLTEARGWLEQALAGHGDQSPVLRRRALTAAASLALLQGNYAVATALAEESLVAARSTGEARYVANALSNLGAIVLAAGDQDGAATLLEEAVALARESGDERIRALALNNLGDLALTSGDYERAGPLFQESLGLLQLRGDTSNMARACFNLGAVALKLGRLEDARARFGESLVLAQKAGDREDLAWSLEGLAALAAAHGQGRRAALLLGAAGALLREMGADYKPFERRLHDATEADARALSDPDAFARAMAEGAAMTLAEALEQALAEGAGRDPHP